MPDESFNYFLVFNAGDELDGVYMMCRHDFCISILKLMKNKEYLFACQFQVEKKENELHITQEQ